MVSPIGVSILSRYTSVLGVIISFDIVSSNSNILSIISFSVSFITPCSCPTSIKERISSLDTFSSKSSSLSFVILSNKFVDPESSFTYGKAIVEIKIIGLIENIAIASAFFKATRLGNNSPNTRVT